MENIATWVLDESYSEVKGRTFEMYYGGEKKKCIMGTHEINTASLN